MLAVLWLGGEAGAQARPPGGRLDAPTQAALQAVLDAARGDSVPVSALEDKALEGIAKQVPLPRIEAALRQLLGELREARALLRAGQERGALADADVVAAGDALRRGVPAAEVTALRRAVPVSTGLMIPLTVLGDLVQRGIPAAQAREVIVALLGAGVSLEQLADLPGRVDVALRAGALAQDALRGALPVPLPSILPPRPPGERPSPGERPAPARPQRPEP
jgi:hypothetical protein